MESIPADVFLADYPDDIREPAERLRAVVLRAVPSALERVRPGWRLIGYDIPIGRRSVYFAFVAPEPIHLHLGFALGVAMADPAGQLEGAHLRLKKVRFLTFRPGEPIPEDTLVDLTQEAARVAGLGRDVLLARALDRDWGPERGG